MQDLSDLSAKKRRDILDAALQEFLDKGFSQARMDCISSRAAVSKRTVYKHFDSKDKLFHAIVDILAERIADELDIDYDPERPIRDQLVDIGWAEGRLFMDDQIIAMFRMIIAEAMRAPELAAGLQNKFDKTRSIAQLMQAAVDDGSLRMAAPQVAAEQFLAMLKARAFWPAILGAGLVTKAELSEIIEAAADVILACYGTPETSRD
ncbi:MAG: TetR/AcrR family transcriptional regulator [Pseudomonadota bacterium]